MGGIISRINQVSPNKTNQFLLAADLTDQKISSVNMIHPGNMKLFSNSGIVERLTGSKTFNKTIGRVGKLLIKGVIPMIKSGCV